MGLQHSSINTQVSYSLQYPVHNGKSIFQIYINLDHRTDRREYMESELQRLNIGPFFRFSAIKHKQGAIGCTLSHIECLKKGIQSGANHIWILEDDVQLLLQPDLFQQIVKCVMETNYDVFLPGYCLNNNNDKHFTSVNHALFKKITDAQCTHNYFVNKKYAPKLLQNFEEGVQKLIKTKKEPKFAIDQYWKRLQVNDMWITYAHGICSIQRPGYSDIDLKVKPNSTNVPVL